VAAGTLATARIADEELVRPLGLIHARGKPLSATVRRFIELLRGHARDTEADVAEATNSGAAAHA
jgi:hypothetical protein